MRFPNQSLAVGHNRSFYASSAKSSQVFIQASLRRGAIFLPGEGPVCWPDQRPRVARLEIDLQCGNKTYNVSTGSDRPGSCNSSTQPSGVGSASCLDDKGNSASVSCASGCGPKEGSGSCSAKAWQ